MSANQLIALGFSLILRGLRRITVAVQIDHYKRSLACCQQTIHGELRAEAYITRQLVLLQSEWKCL